MTTNFFRWREFFVITLLVDLYEGAHSDHWFFFRMNLALEGDEGDEVFGEPIEAVVVAALECGGGFGDVGLHREVDAQLEKRLGVRGQQLDVSLALEGEELPLGGLERVGRWCRWGRRPRSRGI